MQGVKRQYEFSSQNICSSISSSWRNTSDRNIVYGYKSSRVACSVMVAEGGILTPMWYGTIISDFGLALDVVGAFLVYFNGLAPSLSEEGHDMVVSGDPDPKAAAHRKWLSRTGITLLVVGFGLQAIGNHL